MKEFEELFEALQNQAYVLELSYPTATVRPSEERIASILTCLGT